MPGRQIKMTGLYIAFTQEFFDGTAPPPSTLFDYPFMFEGELSSVIHLKPNQGAPAEGLFRDIQLMVRDRGFEPLTPTVSR